MIKPRRTGWTGGCSKHGDKRNAYRSLVGKPEVKGALEGTRSRGWIIIRWILESYDGMVWTGLIWLRIGNSG
jgi:hypothetical protein